MNEGNISKFETVIEGTNNMKPGLYYNGEFVSSLIPSVEEVIVLKKGKNQNDERLYVVKLLEPGVKDYGIRKVDNLREIKYFEDFRCPCALLSKEERRYHLEKLQEDATRNCKEEKVVLDSVSGFVKVENNTMQIFGDEVIKPPNAPDIQLWNPLYRVRKKMVSTEGELDNFIKEQRPLYLSFWPGVSEPLFYIALHCITKLFLVEMKEDSGFLPLLVGPPGHLKTTMAKKYCLWNEDINVQSITFQSHYRNSKLEVIIESFAGSNFLGDDLHSIASDYGRKKQADRLDEFARMATNGKSCAGIVITGESVVDVGIFSCLDRIVQIRIPKLSSSELKEKKLKLEKLDEDFMPEMARYYATQLLNNYDEVIVDIRNFLDENKESAFKDTDGTLRVARHVMYIKLTEYLFRKYCCHGLAALSGTKELNKALTKNRKMQEDELNKIRDEQEHDYVQDLYNILNEHTQKYIKAEVDSDLYDKNNSGSCFFKDNCWYLTRQAMQKCFVNYLNRTVKLSLVVNQLKENGILVQGNSSDCKKFAGKYHYVISADMLRVYHTIKNEDESMFVKCFQKRKS